MAKAAEVRTRRKSDSLRNPLFPQPGETPIAQTRLLFPHPGDDPSPNLFPHPRDDPSPDHLAAAAALKEMQESELPNLEYQAIFDQYVEESPNVAPEQALSSHPAHSLRADRQQELHAASYGPHDEPALPAPAPSRKGPPKGILQTTRAQPHPAGKQATNRHPLVQAESVPTVAEPRRSHSGEKRKRHDAAKDWSAENEIERMRATRKQTSAKVQDTSRGLGRRKSQAENEEP